jgi:outer membrane receptor for ferric coprogen and ferric-rhodotorulic acid
MKSVYGAARWSLTDDLSLITGARVIDVKSDGTNYGLAKSSKNSGKVVPYAGVVYDLNEQYSVYASYTEIFTPQTKTDLTGSRLAPLEGVNYEAGIKGELFDDKVNLSLAVFRTEQDNFAEQAGMIGSVAYYRAIEGLTSEGYELEFSGEPLDGLQLSAGYTFVDITNADGGHAVTYSPKHMVKAAATYRIPGMEKLKVGAAVRWQDDIKIAVPLTADNGFTSIGTADAKQKAYAVVDLMASYDIDPNWSVSANLNNLTDEKYLSSLYWTQAYYGAPRNASMSVSWKY